MGLVILRFVKFSLIRDLLNKIFLVMIFVNKEKCVFLY